MIFPSFSKHFNTVMAVDLNQGDYRYFSGKLGNVREFDSCQEIDYMN